MILAMTGREETKVQTLKERMPDFVTWSDLLHSLNLAVTDTELATEHAKWGPMSHPEKVAVKVCFDKLSDYLTGLAIPHTMDAASNTSEIHINGEPVRSADDFSNSVTRYFSHHPHRMFYISGNRETHTFTLPDDKHREVNVFRLPQLPVDLVVVTKRDTEYGEDIACRVYEITGRQPITLSQHSCHDLILNGLKEFSEYEATYFAERGIAKMERARAKKKISYEF
jgi:hypothetical protein